MAAGVPPNQHVGTFTPSLRTMLPLDGSPRRRSPSLRRTVRPTWIASSEPLDPTIDSTQYATIQGELIRKEFPGFTEHSFGPMALFGDQSGYERRFSWTPPDGVRVHQIQIYFSQAGRGYTATATTPATQLDRYEAELRGNSRSTAVPVGRRRMTPRRGVDGAVPRMDIRSRSGRRKRTERGAASELASSMYSEHRRLQPVAGSCGRSESSERERRLDCRTSCTISAVS